ncbi:HepT-like ribonuclease domain-containing protein [Helicobacter rodentium]|uniref:HepT-like ribonuclease domain-containing protein n=1 Tax=Helicobacter rodentium TaxID=59617 RepID=UPI0023F3F0BE|nr:HepT-like ribonuclease domain-containing protein [Helicobacter rodentium]
MFNQESLERLSDIKERITYIFEICNAIGIVKALEDVKEKQPAIIMHLVVINENLQKIQDDFDINLTEIFTKEDIRGLRAIRNIASHDYDGLNLGIIEDVIRFKLPPIQEKIVNFLENINSNNKKHYCK